MNKVLSVAKTILAWVFVVFCLLMAIGCGSVSGSILFILTAVLSVPLKIVRNLWDKVLGIKEIPDLPEDTPAKWYEAKKKKEQKAHKNAVEDQKKRRLFKPLIIAMAFTISFAVAMGKFRDYKYRRFCKRKYRSNIYRGYRSRTGNRSSYSDT